MKKIDTAVIQAGGKGTRLQTLTGDKIPKPLLVMNGKPILEWQLLQLKKYGIREAVLIIGHLGYKIKEYFGDGSRLGIHIRYIEELQPSGSAGALYYLKQRDTGSDFFLIFGDIIFDIDMNRMEAFHHSKHAAATLLVHPNAHPYDSDLVVMDENMCVTDFSWKNEERAGWYDNCVNAGIYILSDRVLKSMERPGKSDLEKDVLYPLLKSGSVFGYHTPEYVKDTGTPDRFREVEAALINGVCQEKNSKRPQKCVFLDRDGTINKYKGLISRADLLELEHKAAEAVRILNECGYLVILITNQPAVARGMCTVEDIRLIHCRLQTMLGVRGAYLDDIRFCPHHPHKGYPEENPQFKIKCSCRKPAIGMIEEMAERYLIDRSRSYMIGDTTVDIQTGINAGLSTILVRTGEAGQDGKYDVKADFEAADLYEAAKMISEKGK